MKLVSREGRAEIARVDEGDEVIGYVRKRMM